MSYKMFIDDVRSPPQGDWVVVRSTDQAMAYILDRGMPSFISFDHDLGGEDTSMVFLRRLVDQVWNGVDLPPAYEVHSANPVGAANIRAFMDSWLRSHDEASDWCGDGQDIVPLYRDPPPPTLTDAEREAVVWSIKECERETVIERSRARTGQYIDCALRECQAMSRAAALRGLLARLGGER